MQRDERELTGEQFVITPVRQADISSLIDLEQEAFSPTGDAWSQESMIREVTDTPDRFLVVREGQRVIGYVHTQVGHDGFIDEPQTHESEGDGVIGSIAVAQSHRGQGLGERLLRAGMQRLTGLGVPRIVLDTRDSNVDMIRIALKVGFTQARVREGFYVDGGTAINFVLPLR